MHSSIVSERKTEDCTRSQWTFQQQPWHFCLFLWCLPGFITSPLYWLWSGHVVTTVITSYVYFTAVMCLFGTSIPFDIWIKPYLSRVLLFLVKSENKLRLSSWDQFRRFLDTPSFIRRRALSSVFAFNTYINLFLVY